MSQVSRPSDATQTKDQRAWRLLFRFLDCPSMGLPQAEMLLEGAGIDPNTPQWRELLNAINDLEPDSDISPLRDRLQHGIDLANQQSSHSQCERPVQSTAVNIYRPAYLRSNSDRDNRKAKQADHMAASERIAERIRDEVVSRNVRPRILAAETVDCVMLSAPHEKPVHHEQRFEAPDIAQKARLWSVAYFHPYYATAMSQLSSKRIQRARLFGGYLVRHDILREVYHPNLSKHMVSRLIEWRNSSLTDYTWPCPAVSLITDKVDPFSDLSPNVREEVYIFELNVMEWARRRIEETEWCIANLEKNEAVFLAAGGALPPTLVPPPASRLPPPIVARNIQWLVPGHDSTHEHIDAIESPSESFRPWIKKAYLIVLEEDVAAGKGAVVCVSNVTYWIRPPPNTHPVRRIDGTYGEHDETLRPSWVQYGSEAKAFQPSARLGLWQGLSHSDLRRDMMFYAIDWRHLVKVAPQNASTWLIGHHTYRLGPQLRSSLEACMRGVIKEAEHWGRTQSWALPTLPLEVMSKLPQTFVFLSTAEMSKRHFIEHLAMFQRYARIICGWSNWNRRSLEVAEMRREFEQNGQRLDVDAHHELLSVTGGHTRSYTLACMLAEMSVPVWYYARVPLGWQYPPDAVFLKEAHVPYETQQWSDADTQVLPVLRPLRDLDAALSRQLGTQWRGLLDRRRANQLPIGDFHSPEDEPMNMDDGCETSVNLLPDIEEPASSSGTARTIPPGSLRKRKASHSPEGRSAKHQATNNGSERRFVDDNIFTSASAIACLEPLAHERELSLHKNANPEQLQPTADSTALPSPTDPHSEHPPSSSQALSEQPKKRLRKRRKAGELSHADEDVIKRGEALGRKNPLDHTPKNPPEWYPTFYQPAVNAAIPLEEKEKQRVRAQQLANPSTPFFISQKETRRWCKDWRVLPTDKLLTAPKNDHKVFSFAMALHPYLSTHIVTEDLASEHAIGLPRHLWKDASILRPELNADWTVTRPLLQQLGMQSIVDEVEGVVATITPSNQSRVSQISYDLEDEDDADDCMPFHSVDASKEEWDPRYFCNDLPGDTEERRYLYEPTGWRFKERSQRRKRADYKWYFPGDHVEGLGAETYEFEHADTLEWQEILPSNKNFNSKLKWSDVWECYDHGVVLLLPQFGDEMRERATGERFLKPSVFYSLGGLGAGGKRQKRWVHEPQDRNKPLVYIQLSCWHRHDERSGLVVPTDPLGYVGMYSAAGPKFTLPESIARRIFPPLALPSPDTVSNPRPEPQPIPPPTPTPVIESSRPNLAELTSLQRGLHIVFDGVDAGTYNPPDGRDATYDWPSTPLRRRVAYIYACMNFCSEVLCTDSFARRLFVHKPDLQSASNLERRAQVMQVWGGGGIGVYEGLDIASPNWKMRISSLRALHGVMKVWPHTTLLPFPGDDDLRTEQDLQPIEADIWATYAQSYFDFYGRKPAFPPIFDPSAPAGLLA